MTVSERWLKLVDRCFLWNYQLVEVKKGRIYYSQEFHLNGENENSEKMNKNQQLASEENGRSPGGGCVTGSSGGESSAVPLSDALPLALDFLPGLASGWRSSSAASSVLTEASSSTSLVRPLFPAFGFLRCAGVLPLSRSADSEVDGVAGAKGGLLDS